MTTLEVKLCLLKDGIGIIENGTNIVSLYLEEIENLTDNLVILEKLRNLRISLSNIEDALKDIKAIQNE